MRHKRYQRRERIERVAVGFRLPVDLLEDLDSRAAEFGISRTALVVLLLKKGIGRE
ncbi:MAG: RHH DNA-binding protein [Methanosarcina spindle-shaped virus 1]